MNKSIKREQLLSEKEDKFDDYKMKIYHCLLFMILLTSLILNTYKYYCENEFISSCEIIYEITLFIYVSVISNSFLFFLSIILFTLFVNISIPIFCGIMNFIEYLITISREIDKLKTEIEEEEEDKK